MRNLTRFVKKRRPQSGILLSLLAACTSLAVERAFADPAAGRHSPASESTKADHIRPAESSKTPQTDPTETEMEEAVVLSCPGETYRILVLPRGEAFFQAPEAAEEDSSAFQRIPLERPINPPRSALTCMGSRFRIHTSPPYSNRAIDQQFSIDTDGIHLRSRHESDPAEQMIEDSYQIALRGNREALKAIDYSNIEYIYQYVNAHRIQRFLDGAAKRCDQGPCASVVESTFFLITRLSSAVSGIDSDPGSPASWLRALDHVGVTVPDATPVLLRYVEALRRGGRLKEAATLLGGMVQRDPAAPDLHLIYGDLLWDLSQKDQARREYRLFADLLSKDGRVLPVRVARLLTDH